MTASEERQAGAPFKMIVERGKIREFARATKSTNPDYLKADDPVAPATFLVTSAFWQDAPVRQAGANGAGAGAGAGAGYERLLHGAQEFIFFGEPPRAGTVPSVQTRPGPEYE